MRFLFLTSEFPPRTGSIASHVDHLSRALARRGHEIDLFTLDRDPDGRVVPAPGVTVMRARFPMTAKPVYDFFLRRWLRRVIAEAPPDVVHVHGLQPLAASRVCAPVPVVFTNHGSDFLARGSSRRRAQRANALMRHLTAVIATSRERAQATRDIGVPGECLAIPNGVDIETFCPNPDLRRRMRKTMDIADDVPVILLAARLEPTQGGRFFAEACRKLAPQACRILIAGDGPERREMERIFGSSGLAARSWFLGALPSGEMPALYAASDIAVLPTLSGATGTVALEAMASGLPVVGSNVSGIPEIIASGRTGLLVPPADPDALAATLAKLLASDDRRRALGQAARRAVLESFSWGAVAERTEAVYAYTLSEQTGR